MLSSFVASWPLFHHAYLAGWLIAIPLAILGVLMIARDQIFLGAAIAQASTLGIAVALSLEPLLVGLALPFFLPDSFRSAMAMVFAMLAALLTTPGKRRPDSHESLTGWVFLTAASGAVLLMAQSPYGMEEIQRLMSSSLIGATARDVHIFAFCTGVTLLSLSVWHRAILLGTLDPTMAMAVGIRWPLWSFLITLWSSILIGLSMRVAGVLYTFGCLILPALIAKHLCREMRLMFFVAPSLALATAIVGSVLADLYDYPPAQMTIMLLSSWLPLVWQMRRWRERRERQES